MIIERVMLFIFLKFIPLIHINSFQALGVGIFNGCMEIITPVFEVTIVRTNSLFQMVLSESY